MRKAIWIAVIVTVGCTADRDAGKPCAMGENPWWTGCSPGLAAQQQAVDAAKYKSVVQTINANSVAGCRSLGVVPGQNELEPGVIAAADMGANTVLLGSTATAREGPYYDYARTGSTPIYYNRTYVAMEAYVCPGKPAEAAAK